MGPEPSPSALYILLFWISGLSKNVESLGSRMRFTIMWLSVISERHVVLEAGGRFDFSSVSVKQLHTFHRSCVLQIVELIPHAT